MRPSQLSLYHGLGKQRALQRKFISKIVCTTQKFGINTQTILNNNW